ncbi:MAG: GDSL-type esterase/lipase family protein [Verrucomicrobiota bacterium]
MIISTASVSRKSFPLLAAIGLYALGVFQPVTGRAEVQVKNGEKIAFLGDSITQQGASSPSGYVWLVASGLETNGIKVTPIGAGIGGHKSNNMLQRLENDVLNKKPDWMTLSCGVNDVWHGANGVPLEDYKKNFFGLLKSNNIGSVRSLQSEADRLQ